MKMYKLIFFNSMILGTLISVSSYSWFSMWMGLEINLLSIIPLFSKKNNMMASESALKYFITQAMASLILLMSVIMLLMSNEFITPLMNFNFLLTLNSSLMMKLGAAPFHFWFPEVMEGLTWMNCLILLTWQKIAPMMLMMNNKINLNFLIMIILSCLMVSTVMGFNQVSLRKILAFSSINHIAWMLTSFLASFSLWMIYFLVYCLININIVTMMNMTKLYYLVQIPSMMNENKILKLSFMMNFLSLGGLPPFIGFMPKWLLINWLTANSLYMITALMIVVTLVMLFIYTRILLSSMMMAYLEPKSSSIKMNSFVLILINTITMMSLILCTLTFNFM